MRNGLELRVGGLSTADAQSLAATLATAAIVGQIDPADGTLVVLHSRDKVFAVAQLELVIDEWIAADRRRSPTIAVSGRRNEKGAPRYLRLEPGWSPRGRHRPVGRRA